MKVSIEAGKLPQEPQGELWQTLKSPNPFLVDKGIVTVRPLEEELILAAERTGRRKRFEYAWENLGKTSDSIRNQVEKIGRALIMELFEERGIEQFDVNLEPRVRAEKAGITEARYRILQRMVAPPPAPRATNKLMGQEFGKSPETIKNQVQAMFETTGARTRQELIRIAIRNRWVE